MDAFAVSRYCTNKRISLAAYGRYLPRYARCRDQGTEFGPGEFEIGFPTTNGSSPLLQRRIAEGAAELLLAGAVPVDAVVSFKLLHSFS